MSGLPIPPPPLSRYDHLYKIILIGDPSVGKSNLTIRFCDGGFSNTYVGTIGIDFKVRTVEIDGTKIKLQIWDTAGQERFQSITQVYYRGTMGVIFVYDITDRLSFEHLRTWIQTFHGITGYEARKMIIGNKTDMFCDRQVDWDEAERVAKAYDCLLFETSAKSGYNVEDAFLMLARNIKKYQEKKIEEAKSQPIIIVNAARRSRYRKSKSFFSKCSLL